MYGCMYVYLHVDTYVHNTYAKSLVKCSLGIRVDSERILNYPVQQLSNGLL